MTEIVQEREKRFERRAVATVRGLVRLCRPLNVLMFLTGTALGGVLSAGFGAFIGESGERLLVAAVSAALIGVAANAINDVYDQDIDRINRPGRPLPAGEVGESAARGVWLGGSVLGVLLGASLSVPHVAIAVVSVGLCYAYSRWFKRTPLTGNVIVAVVTPLTLLVYGGWAVGHPGPALVGAAFAFLTTFAREIVKDIQDMRGDAAVGARTFAVVAGGTRAAFAASAVIVATVVLTPVPFLFLGYSSLYLVIVLLADALLLRALWLLQESPTPANASRSSNLLKWAMLMGILALASSGILS